MTKLARWCFGHRRVVLAVWFAALVLSQVLSGAAGSGYADSFKLPGTESTRALTLLQDNFKGQSGDSDTIVWRAKQGSVTDPAVRERINTAFTKIRKLPHVSGIDSPYASTGAQQVSKDRKIAYATVRFDAEANDVGQDTYKKLVDIGENARQSNLQVELGGQGIQFATQQEGNAGEALGFIAAAIVLFIAFGSLLAMTLPLITAIFAIGTALALTNLLAHVIDIATFSPQLATLIGLGVGIDYALFVVTRHRNAIKAGRTPEEAVVRSLNTSGRAVIFAGGTVCVALLGLLVLGVNFLNGVAIAATITVLVTVIAAITLVPALLGFYGMKVLSRKERRRLEELGPRDPKLEGFWARWAAFVQRTPVPLALAGLVVMIALAIPLFGLRLGSSDAGQDPPSSTTRKAYDLLATAFGPGFNGPLQLVATTPNGKGDLPKLQALAKDVAKQPGVASVTPPVPGPKGNVAIIQVTPTTAPQDEATSKLIKRLRNDVVPKAVGSADTKVYVGGLTAIFDDFSRILTNKLPLFIVVIVALGCLLLLIAFRSLLVPAVAAVMNLLAAGAAFGVITAVFQKGFLAGPLGVGEGPIEAFLPVMLLAILFGLSMDYQVFLVSRMHEEWLLTGDNRKAVTAGQAGTGRVITAAATIMVLVFLSFLLGGQRVIAEFGIGLGAAVFLDAFVLRTVVVPSLMHLIGDANWKLPGWLDRAVPHVAVEPSDLEPAKQPAAAR
jgi:putative drug exporter of the RND superfamily